MQTKFRCVFKELLSCYTLLKKFYWGKLGTFALKYPCNKLYQKLVLNGDEYELCVRTA